MPESGPIWIAVINMKGGVGKTTVATLLARHAARDRGLKVLAIDLDPQANLSQALMGQGRYEEFFETKAPSIVEVFEGYVPPTSGNPAPSPLHVADVVQNVVGDLSIIPSRFDFSENLVNSTRTDRRVLARVIASNFQDKDIVIIDCAPTESILTQAAYHASRHILVPVKPEFLATIGFPLLNRSLETFRNANPGHSIDVIGVVINDTSDYQAYETPEKEAALRQIHEEAEKNCWYIFENWLYYSRGFPKMMRSSYPTWPGDAPFIFREFANELFDQRLAL